MRAGPGTKQLHAHAHAAHLSNCAPWLNLKVHACARACTHHAWPYALLKFMAICIAKFQSLVTLVR